MNPKKAIFDDLFSWFAARIDGSVLSRGKVVAEFGVGKYGFSSFYLEKYNKVYGIDIEDYSDYHPGVIFVLASDKEIPLPDASVDLVVSHSVLEHVEDLYQSLSELSRITVPGGVLYLTVSPLYYAAFGSHLYRDGNRLDNWQHLVRDSDCYLTRNPAPDAATKGHYLNGLTCQFF